MNNVIEGQWGTKAPIYFFDEICGSTTLTFTSRGTYKLKILDTTKWQKTSSSINNKINEVTRSYLSEYALSEKNFTKYVNVTRNTDDIINKYFEKYPDDKNIFEFTEFKFVDLSMTDESREIYEQCKKNIINNTASQVNNSDSNLQSQVQVSNSNSNSNTAKKYNTSTPNMTFIAIGIVVVALVVALVIKLGKKG